ncbi:hypothetical protein I302_102494 [Kwoniella bestiolae CBS 10118]|uniref:Post-GPI attachment to proteins factor 3 n=1 Tax=Kwoniella bestiolae CBS 10118 TaxID=1296100 RepID=A0A1B9GF51_9TREE|nr:hypothetical protein I302_01185 [Kwoniella bestiolae CBS 10118]OCF29673.1 hypothetical protein I302_01185 [Kwoniella bestiolae CBS 10118]
MAPRPTLLLILSLALVLALPILASSGDRNPTFQHCLKGCQLTYCEPHQPPLPGYLRAFGWTCKENCAYECGHTFTDHIRPGSKAHQFYGKWAFYRLGPFQEPFSILMSLGNLYVNLKGLEQLRRRVRKENGMRSWLTSLGWVQVNTWIWSSVFHARDTPTTERLDYFSATLTISFTLLYTLIRIFHLRTPMSSSRLLIPIAAILAFIVLGHFTYLLSFPLGSFPYGYHTKFNLVLASIHNLLWIAWTLSFKYPYPRMTLLGKTYSFPKPYPPHEPLQQNPKPKEWQTPMILVFLTTCAMGFELFDFSPVFRVIDAHSLWHASTIPLTIAWWHFMVEDTIELEGTMLSARSRPLTQSGNAGEKGEGVEGEGELEVPRTPNFIQIASTPKLSKGLSPGRSPKVDKPE